MRRPSVMLLAFCAMFVWVGVVYASQFKDNGDGTVTDNTTGLMWEKKTGIIGAANPGDVHDVNNTYTWCTGSASVCTNPENLADGTAFTVFLAMLNNGASVDGKATTPITGCFANHCDWRLPSIVELQGILDLSATGCGDGGACIDPIFGPTQGLPPDFGFYWSTTTFITGNSNALGVGFGNGKVGNTAKFNSFFVRAVRTRRTTAAKRSQ
jgi:uncharacterized protein DUF1566